MKSWHLWVIWWTPPHFGIMDLLQALSTTSQPTLQISDQSTTHCKILQLSKYCTDLCLETTIYTINNTSVIATFYLFFYSKFFRSRANTYTIIRYLQCFCNSNSLYSVHSSASPITTTTTVIGVKFDKGCVIAGDTLGSYGSLARFRDCPRITKVNDLILLGSGGDYADYQYLKDIIDQKMWVFISFLYSITINITYPSILLLRKSA